MKRRLIIAAAGLGLLSSVARADDTGGISGFELGGLVGYVAAGVTGVLLGYDRWRAKRAAAASPDGASPAEHTALNESANDRRLNSQRIREVHEVIYEQDGKTKVLVRLKAEQDILDLLTDVKASQGAILAGLQESTKATTALTSTLREIHNLPPESHHG